MHLSLCYIVFICHENDVHKNDIGSVYVGGYCDFSESGLCVFGKLCPIVFLVVCKCCCCCCIPTPPCLFGGVLPYFEVTGHPVSVPSL